MKIEFGFQSNCSELVAHLGIVDRDETIKAMKIISNMTGWTWGVVVCDGPSIFTVPIPIEKLNRVMLPSNRWTSLTRENLPVDIEKLISIWSDDLDERQTQLLRTKGAPDGWLALEVYDWPEDRLVLPPSEESDSSLIDLADISFLQPYTFTLGCGCGRKGLTLITDNHWAESFPQFQAITREFDSHFDVEDCGYNPIYAEWLAVHFLPEEFPSLMKELYDDPKERSESVSYMKEHLPVVESKELTKYEQEAISEFRDFLKDLKKERMKEKNQEA